MFNVSKQQSTEKTAQETQQEGPPYEDIDKYFADLENSFFTRNWMSPFQWPTRHASTLALDGRVPNVDVVEREDDILVKAELPGIEKKDIDINVSDRTVTIKAERSKEKKEEKGSYYRHEISSAKFLRSVTLPGTVDMNKAKAQFKDGVLELTLPKTEQAKRKKVAIE